MISGPEVERKKEETHFFMYASRSYLPKGVMSSSIELPV